MTLPIFGEAVTQLIPQKPPFVMVDGLVSCTEEACESTFTPTVENVLVENGYFTEFGLTEHIAQTGALQSGYLSHKHGTKPPVGFIGQIKGLQIHFLPKIGQQIQTKIEHLHKVANVSVILGKSVVNGEICAECEMKIFLQE
jgi:3-hydroxyacyl-[acyl-carrier-protein] dehydratase